MFSMLSSSEVEMSFDSTTPMTSPRLLTAGPPELPELIAASVWQNSPYPQSEILCAGWEMTPALTESPTFCG